MLGGPIFLKHVYIHMPGGRGEGGMKEVLSAYFYIQGAQRQQFNEGREFGMAVVTPSVEALGMTQCKSPNLK